MQISNKKKFLNVSDFVRLKMIQVCFSSSCYWSYFVGRISLRQNSISSTTCVSQQYHYPSITSTLM